MPKDDQQQPVKDDTPAPAAAAAGTAPQAPVDPTELRDTSPESLSSVFKAFLSEKREQRAQFRPTLARLNEIVSKFHAIGNDQVGIELANFERLREFNLVSKPSGEEAPFYGILSVHEARFLIRIYPDQKIDCYTENLAKPSLTVQSLDSDEFWYKTERSSGGSVKINKSEARFLRYNLENSEDVLELTKAILQTSAACTANEELKEFDVAPARENTVLSKAPGLKIRKP
jgi:hypothetical protein